MISLLDLDHDWTTVAYWVRVTAHVDGWQWTLPPHEIALFHVAVEQGAVEVHQERGPNGRLIKIARKAHGQNLHRGPLAFALAGRGLFDHEHDGRR